MPLTTDSPSTAADLLLTPRSKEVHAVDGLDAGADDYIAKPFRLAELLARVRAAARRAEFRTLMSDGIRIEPHLRRAFLHEAELSLSPKEFDLLARLVADTGHVVSCEQLLRDVWQTTWLDSRPTRLLVTGQDWRGSHFHCARNGLPVRQGRVRRRLLISTLMISVLTVLVLGIPLSLVARHEVWAAAREVARRESTTVAAGMRTSWTPGYPLTSPGTPPALGVFASW